MAFGLVSSLPLRDIVETSQEQEETMLPSGQIQEPEQ